MAGHFSRVYALVAAIPSGQVTTYGQIASLLGDPRGARTVGWALHSNPYPGVVPCHRVVNKRGELSGGFAFGGPEVQRSLLEQEGVSFLPDGRVDLERHLWQPDRRDATLMETVLGQRVAPVHRKRVGTWSRSI